MVRWRSAAAMMLAPLAASAVAQDGSVFGIRMGQSVATIPGAKKFSGNAYEVATLPTPNSEFESYMVYATPRTGVCKVSGLGKTYENDRYGSSASHAFGRLKLALQQRYGSSSDFDFLRSGAIWDEPQDYLMSILKKERSKSSFWTRQNGSHLPTSIEAIGLEMRAVDSGLYVALSYEFTNYDQCKAARDAVDNAGL